MASADFDQAIAESHAATDGVLKGNPDGFKALYSRSEDITLGNRSAASHAGGTRWPSS
jgi:hypothetical protein